MNTEFAYNLGAEFAAQINDSVDRDNWSEMDSNADLPEFDYIELKTYYRFDDLESADIRKIESAYRDGFNSVFAA